jgi:hypothetical protein
MKKRVIVVILLIVAAAVAGTLTRSARQKGQAVQNGTGESTQDGESMEIRQSYKLQPGAQVLVTGINGKVEIETSDTDTAEIYIQRTARKPEDLERRRIIIENTDTSLTIRTEQKKTFSFLNFWHGGNSASERVTLKLPRQISLKTKGVNGSVNIGEVAGTLEISGVNGKVEAVKAAGYTEVSGVNGPIVLTVGQLDERGLKINGINGSIELRLKAGVNADFQAKGMNGSVKSEVADVVVEKDAERSRYSAKIGSGGAPITITGINGSVRFTRPSV